MENVTRRIKTRGPTRILDLPPLMKAKVLSDNTCGTIHFISVITYARCDKSACFHYYAKQNTRTGSTKPACCDVIVTLISDYFINAREIKIYFAVS